MASTIYNYTSEPSYSDGVYTRTYVPDTTISDAVYDPGEFFNAFSGRSAVAAKLSYAKSGLGIPGGSSDTFTDTFNPSTGSTSTGTEFRMVSSFTGTYARDPYNEYSLVADPISGLYDVYIKNTSNATYIDSAEYSSSSWTTTTDTAHGRVIIGTNGNSNAIVVADDIVEVNNSIIPKVGSAYNLGSALNKWDAIHVKTIYADNYEGLPDSGDSGGGGSSQTDVSTLKYNGNTKAEAVSDGVNITGTLKATEIYSSSTGVIHAWGSGKDYGLRLCDGDYESTAYSSITGYQSSTNGQMIFHFVNASSNIEFSIENTGPNTSSSGSESLTTIPSRSGAWQLGSSSYKLGDIYCTTIHADTYDGSGGLSVSNLYGSGSGGLYFFRLYFSSSGTASRGDTITLTSGGSGTLTHGGSSYTISSYDQGVDDVSYSSYSSGIKISGTFKSLMDFKFSSNNVFVPCVRIS